VSTVGRFRKNEHVDGALGIGRDPRFDRSLKWSHYGSQD